MDRLTRFFDYVPYLVFFIFLSFSVFLYTESVKTLKKEINHTLSMTATDMADAIESRMGTYEQVLRGGEGFYAANDYEVTRDMWQTYISRLRLQERFPGMQAVGFTKIVSKEEAPQHIRHMREIGTPSYEIHPRVYNDKMVVVCNMYPETVENIRVMGFDLHSEPVRAAMLDYAEQSGRAALSGKMVLKQELNETSAPAGVLMALPIYRNGKIYGFIAAPFRVNRLMEGIFGPSTHGLELSIYDKNTGDANLMYRSGSGAVSQYNMSIPVELYGRIWILQFSAGKEFLRQFDFNKPLIILMGGVVTGALLAMLIFILLKTRSTAYEIAERMSQKLSESEDRYRKTFEQAAVGIIMASTDGRIIKSNSCLSGITGYSIQDLRNMSYTDLLSEADQVEFKSIVMRLAERRIDTFDKEKIVVRKDGSMVWVNLTVSAFFDNTGTPLYLICIVEDITRRKKAEESIVALSMRQAAILDNSLVAIAQVKDGMIEWVNQAAENIFKYSANELIGRRSSCVFPSDEEYKKFRSRIESTGEYHEFGMARTQSRMQKKNGETIWADISGKRISKDPNSAYIWVLNDITERVTAENMLRDLNSGLEQKVASETEKRRLQKHQR